MRNPCKNCPYWEECDSPCDKYIEFLELGPDPEDYEDRPILQQYVPR